MKDNSQIPIARPSLGNDELKAVGEVFKTGWLGQGSTVVQFEGTLSDIYSGSEVIAVNSGTTALHLAIDALDIGQGDEVIVPAMTFVGTIQAISQTGAAPVFCDIQSHTLNIDPADIIRKITPRTKAIIPVHYRGFPCDMDEICDIAQQNKIAVIEDAAHAFGSFYREKRIGTVGDITCFSFDPIKNITCGEGGAIITRNKILGEKIRKKRMLGINRDTWVRYKEEKSWSYDVSMQGYRYHMSNINAAIGIEQLKKFDRNNSQKIKIARQYDRAFNGLSGIELLHGNYEKIGLFCYIIKVLSDKRDPLMNFLKSHNIISGIHYIPCHYFTLYKQYKKELPATEKAFEEILTLPLFPSLTEEECVKVISTVKEFFHGELPGR